MIFFLNFNILGLTRCKGFPGGSEGKESACNAGNMGSIPGSRSSSGEGNGESHRQRKLAGYSL